MIKIGDRYERLTVAGYAGKNHNGANCWFVACDCGARAPWITTTSALNSGRMKSCGCYNRDQIKTRPLRHGHSAAGKHTKEYCGWNSMLQRCYNPKAISFSRYGKRGIEVCVRWRESFEAFLEDMGYAPIGTSIERKDNSLGYYKKIANGRRNLSKLTICGPIGMLMSLVNV